MDGNGRVARLFSHALLRELDVGSELWSVSRGLARSVENYKTMLQAADEPPLSVEVGVWRSPRLACDLRCWARFSLHVVASTGAITWGLGRASAFDDHGPVAPV